MQIQVNTDKNVEANEDLIRQVESEVEARLARFSDAVTRIEVHLGDESAGRSGGTDMRCLMEARTTGQRPVAVTHHAATSEEACSGAAQKLQRLLDSRFGRLDDRKGGASIRQEEPRGQ
jgi:hypothetical protein